MSRRRRGDEDEETFSYEEEEEEERRGKRRRRSEFIDDIAEEDSEEEDDDEEDEEEGGSRRRRRRTAASHFIDDQAVVASDDEDDEEEEVEDGFIVHGDEEEENGGSGGATRMLHRNPLPLPLEEEEDVEALEKRLQEKYGGNRIVDDDEEEEEVEDSDNDDYDETRQQALLPSVRDPKLWMVKCAIGHERETALCLIQKHMNRGSDSDIPMIKSAIAIDHLKSYIYIEADKEAHVRQACKGLRNIFHSVKPMLVPIQEMTDVVSVRSTRGGAGDFLAMDSWVRMKIPSYKGDLGRVVEVNDVMKKVTVKLVPRIDLQAMADKLEGLEVVKKKFIPQRLMSIDEAKDLGIPTNCKRDRSTGEYFESIGGMKFKDGFLLKTVSMRSISTQNVQPTLDEFEKFWMPENARNLNEAASEEGLFGNGKKTQFSQGNAVIVIGGDLVNLMGSVERVEDSIVYVIPKTEDLPEKAIPINEKYLSKYFKPGDHVKVVSGEREGESGMVFMVQGRKLRVVSDVTKEDIQVFAQHVVGSSEVTSGVPRVGDYELHDLVLLDNGFGVILRVESGAFQVLKGNTENPEVVVVRLREIKTKLDRKISAQDRDRNVVSVKDIVTIIGGPCKGRQGTVEHIYRGVLFIRDRSYLEHSGFIWVKAQFCTVVGGTGSKAQNLASYPTHRTGPQIPTNNGRPPRGGPDFRGRHMAGARDRDSLVGTRIKICGGLYKGLRGIVKEAHGKSVRVELESQMKVVSVDRNQISDKVAVSSQQGSQTPLHSARTPMRPCMTPLRDDPRATPIHDGMRTPMRDRAWNPYYAPVTPARENWEDDASLRSSPVYQPATPPVRLRESSPAYRRTPTHQSSNLSTQPLTVESPAYRRTPTHESSHLSPRPLTVGSQ